MNASVMMDVIISSTMSNGAYISRRQHTNTHGMTCDLPASYRVNLSIHRFHHDDINILIILSSFDLSQYVVA